MFTNCHFLDIFDYICAQNAQCWDRVTKTDMDIQISEFFHLHRISATPSPKLDKEKQISATLSPIFNGNEISPTVLDQFIENSSAMVTTLPSVFCSALVKAKRWWNMPLPAWTTNSLSLLICSSCQTRVHLKSSCWMK